MALRHNLYLVLAVFLVGACAPRPVSSERKEDAGRKTAATNIENIDAYRPTFPPPPDIPKGAAPEPVAPTNHINDKVRVLMDSVASANKSIKFAQGFRIMAYNGTDRRVAMDTRRAIIERIPEQKDYLQYQQPTYRLKIGDYFTRMEAQQTLLRLRDILPNALIIPDQINIR